MNALFSRLFKTTPNNYVDESRRRVLRGALGLAAIAAVGVGGSATPLDKAGIAEFLKAAEAGLVDGYTFYLDRTLVIEGCDGLVIQNCSFVAVEGFEGEFIMSINSENLLIQSCCFDTRNMA